MAWFGILRNKHAVPANPAPERRRAISPTAWEVLSQVDNAQEVEVSGTTTTGEAGDGSGSEDETLVIVEGEDELKNQIKGLRKQLEESQRKTQSLEEKLLQRNSAIEVLQEESDGVLSCTQAELYEARQKVQKYEGEVV